MFDPSELNTILAALRYWQWQRHNLPMLNARAASIFLIESNDDTEEPLTDAEIDALCERLNTSSGEEQLVDLLALLEPDAIRRAFAKASPAGVFKLDLSDEALDDRLQSESHAYDIDGNLLGQGMTWGALAALPEGTRVRFVEAWDIFPWVLVKAGTLATVERNGLNELGGIAEVMPDNCTVRELLRSWDGRIQLDPESRSEGWDDPSPVVLA